MALCRAAVASLTRLFNSSFLWVSGNSLAFSILGRHERIDWVIAARDFFLSQPEVAISIFRSSSSLKLIRYFSCLSGKISVAVFWFREFPELCCKVINIDFFD
jgi:hypothetical protein